MPADLLYPSGSGTLCFSAYTENVAAFPCALDLYSPLEDTSCGHEKGNISRGCPLLLQKQRAFLLHFTKCTQITLG